MTLAQTDRVAKVVEFTFEACFNDNLWDDAYSDLSIWESGGTLELNFYLDSGYNECLNDSDHMYMKPGVEYGVYFDNYETYGEEIVVSAPIGWLLQVTESSSSEIVVRKVYTGSTDFTMKLVPGDYWDPDRTPEPVVMAGEASSLSNEGVIWSVGLGSLTNGRSAGVLQLRDGYISGLLGTRKDIKFSVTNPEIDYYAPNDELYQIFTPQTVVNLTNTDPGKFEIKFYDWTQAGTKTGNGGNTWTVSGDPFVTYEIYKINSSTLKITKTSGPSPNTQTWTTRLTYSSNVWTLYDWTLGGSETSDTLRKVTTTVTPGSTRYSLVKKYGRNSSGGSFVQSSATRYTKTNNSWGYSLTKVEKGYGTSTPVQTTDYEYYTAGNATGLLKKVTRPDGSATRYTYETVGEKLGLLKERFESFESDVEGRKTHYTYELDDSVTPAKLYAPDVVTR